MVNTLFIHWSKSKLFFSFIKRNDIQKNPSAPYDEIVHLIKVQYVKW